MKKKRIVDGDNVTIQNPRNMPLVYPSFTPEQNAENTRDPNKGARPEKPTTLLYDILSLSFSIASILASNLPLHASYSNLLLSLR